MVRPEGLLPAVHTVLQRWYSGLPADFAWPAMWSVARHAGPASAAEPDLAVKQLFLQALDALDKQPGGELGQILRLRFLDEMTAQQVAYRLNLSENVVYKRQRAALDTLADAIWQLETSAREAYAGQILARLETARPAQLFGVHDRLQQLIALLAAGRAPWIVAVVGIGGIGKTALADAAVRSLLDRPSFADVAWVSARQSSLGPWIGAQPTPPPRPALTRESMADTLCEQLGLRDLFALPAETKWRALQDRLRSRPYLVVVDNLETAADYRALVPHLHDLSEPSRFLLTCRDRLDGYPGVYSLSLDELSAGDSLALLRHQAQERGLNEVAAAPDAALLPVYEVTGGNPLALKLLVGQMHAFSIPRIVHDLRQAHGAPVHELYRHIYWRAWHLLSAQAQQVLAVMPLVAETGGEIVQIGALSEVVGAALTGALQQLIALSLVEVRGTLDVRRYGIHRLTETFMLNEVIGWQSQA